MEAPLPVSRLNRNIGKINRILYLLAKSGYTGSDELPYSRSSFIVRQIKNIEK